MDFKKIFENMNTKKEDTIKDIPEDQKEANTENQEEKNEEKTSSPEETKLAELQAKVNELNDKYLRLYSEFDNYRKRVVKERIELIKSGGEDIFKDILPVIDDFERAIKSTNEATEINAVKEGVNLIYNKFKNTLAQKGLEPIESIGKDFNTDMHEAITNMPAPSEDMKGKVIDELEKGYFLNGKVIRFTKVIVGT